MQEPVETAVEAPDLEVPAAGSLSRPGKVAGAIWFLLLALNDGRGLHWPTHATPTVGDAFAAWAPVASRACGTAFFITLAWLMMARPPAVARRPGLVTVLIALTGTYGVWLVGYLPQAPLPPALMTVSAVLSLVGSILIVFTVIHLGRSFSIAPQARALVTRGPYAIVRHPLYAAEELAVVGLAMHIVWYAAVPFVAAHVALQLRRMSYEEHLLREVFPGYDAYARRTARLIPGIW